MMMKPLPMATGQRHGHGFTLMELLISVVVMTIIALTIGLAGPRIGAGLGRLELNRAEQLVKAEMKFAKVQARRTDRRRRSRPQRSTSATRPASCGSP